MKAGTPDERGIRQVGELETDEMRVAAVGIAANSTWSSAHEGCDRLVVMLDKIRDTGEKEKNSPFPAAMLASVPAGSARSVSNHSAQEMKLMVVEFKDTLGARSAGR